MNNTLTAKEWIDVNIHLFTKGNRDNIWVDSMEKYANYKNRILEDRIKEYRQKIVDTIEQMNNSKYGITIDFLGEYDKHFNIENKQ